MAVIRDDVSTRHGESEAESVLEAEEARQADSDRENLRILDRSLPLAILALAIVGIYIAAVAAT